MPSISEKLKNHLENGENWGKLESPIQGVYIVKVPKTKTRKAMLYLEINPLKENGKPLKKKGVFINSQEMLLGFNEALKNEKSHLLISIIDQINRKEIFDLNENKEDLKVIPEEEIEELEIVEEIRVTSEKEPKKGERLYVDIANILYMDRNGHGKMKVENIPKIIETLKNRGYTPILIADASIKHEMGDKKKYERMIVEKIVREAPEGRPADIFILEQARKEDCKFLTNDLYRDFFDKFDKDWIFTNRLTCMFEDGEIIID